MNYSTVGVTSSLAAARIGSYPVRFPDKRYRRIQWEGCTVLQPVYGGMPRISPEILETTFYLYKSPEDAKSGKAFGGTGFLVSVELDPIPGRPEKLMAPYAVSNWHVACQKYPIVRLHNKDGTLSIKALDPADWVFIPDGNDVAVAPLPLDVDRERFKCIPTDMFMTREQVEDGKIGVGDDVFMVGRFIDHDGGERNAPAARFGHISMMPQPIFDPESGKYRESYCVDMHSRTGYSGSLVFVYRTPGGDLSKKGIEISRFQALLGIHWGQFPEMWEITKKGKLKESVPDASLLIEGQYVKGMSGMTCVAPSWSILETLEVDELKKRREKLREDTAQDLENKPLPPETESETSVEEIAERRDEMLETMLNTPPDPKRGAKN